VGPGSINIDMALSRTFRIRERWQVMPRAEAFNIINHVNYLSPGLSLNSSNFGVLSAAGDPRILQFALKVQF
jgi:hypothetical protein